MAVTPLEFKTNIDKWVAQSEQRILAVWKESTKLTIRKAQERIPVDTGFARASIQASLESMPPIESGKSKPLTGTFQYNSSPVVLVIANAKLGQTIYVGWTANYVQALENGHSKQAPSGFVGLAALEWDATVKQVTEILKQQNGVSID